MAGLSLGGRTAVTYVQPTNPPSASGTSATALAFGGAQVSGTGKTAATGGTIVGIASLVLLVLMWKSLPR